MVERGFDPENKPARKPRRGVRSVPRPIPLVRRIFKPHELQPPHPNNPTRAPLKKAA